MMTQHIYTLIFVLLVIAIYLNSGISKELRKRKKFKERLKHQRELVLGRKKKKMEVYVSAEKDLIRATSTDMKVYVALFIGSLAGGFLFGKLVYSDSVISLFTAMMFIIVPHVFLITRSNSSRRDRAEQLETAMRLITHEYISSLDIQTAVKASLEVIEHDKPFKEFVFDCEKVSSNIERNLRRLESKENNVFFSKWIDQLILAQSDRHQIVNLMPIIDEMNDAKTAQRLNDTSVAGAWRDYFTMLGIMLLFPLLIRIVNVDWYNSLVDTLGGKILIVLMLASLIWSTLQAMKINKPITG